MRNKLLIIGASGHGKVCADIAIRMNLWADVVFLDDNESIKSSMGIKVVGKTSDAIHYLATSNIVIGIGNNIVREKIQTYLEKKGASIPALIHPTAVLGTNVEIGEGTVVMAGAVINCCTKIGKGCVINTGSTIDHDTVIGDYVHISPGVHIAGSVGVGSKSWLGIGSTVINNVEITSDTTIGAGGVVVNNISKPGTYVGVPAKMRYKNNESEE
ncbi:acetyltransferase [Caldifermentibacillus hisashii]|uniref:acetyltransferase n=1 Tax=Caldifermentibacillus hisashii TaxID=996558 RepID=UPI002E02F337|nr:acetyltransferase [Caldifermentibacillus hisashii]